jgi:hypothetical protein
MEILPSTNGRCQDHGGVRHTRSIYCDTWAGAGSGLVRRRRRRCCFGAGSIRDSHLSRRRPPGPQCGASCPRGEEPLRSTAPRCSPIVRKLADSTALQLVADDAPHSQHAHLRPASGRAAVQARDCLQGSWTSRSPRLTAGDAASRSKWRGGGVAIACALLPLLSVCTEAPAHSAGLRSGRIPPRGRSGRVHPTRTRRGRDSSTERTNGTADRVFWWTRQPEDVDVFAGVIN